MKKLDLTGQKFNRLLVLHEDPKNNKQKVKKWICLCNCGNQKSIEQYKLKIGHTKSCGCLNDEQRKNRNMSVLHNAWRKRTPLEATALSVWNSRYNDGYMSFEEFIIFAKENCFYCGAQPNNSQNPHLRDKRTSQYAKDTGTFIYNGIDRLDSNLPHQIDNCVPCCKWCNWSKSDRNLEEFKAWVIKLFNNFGNTNKHPIDYVKIKNEKITEK